MISSLNFLFSTFKSSTFFSSFADTYSILVDQSEENDKEETEVGVEKRTQPVKQQQIPKRTCNINEMTMNELNEVLKETMICEENHKGGNLKEEEEDNLDMYDEEQHMQKLEDIVVSFKVENESLKVQNNTLCESLDAMKKYLYEDIHK